MATGFSEIEGDASGAVGWLPLSTIIRVIPLLVAFLPLETVAAGAVAGMAPFSIVKPEIGVATEAIFFAISAYVPAPPVGRPMHPLAAVHCLVVMRKEKDEEEGQQSAPPQHKHCSLPVREGYPSLTV